MPFSIKPMHHAPGRSTPRRGLVRYVGADIMQKMLLLMAVLTAEGLLMPNVACSKGAFAPTSRMASRARTFCQVTVEDVDAVAVEVEPVAKKAPRPATCLEISSRSLSRRQEAIVEEVVEEEVVEEEPEPEPVKVVADLEQTRCSRSQRSSLLQTSACGRTEKVRRPDGVRRSYQECRRRARSPGALARRAGARGRQDGA